MRDCSVVRRRPSRAAAPAGPLTTPPEARSAARIAAFSTSSSRLSAGRVGRLAAGRRARRRLEERDAEDAVRRQDRRALDHVLQLADVAGPVPVLERVHGFRRNRRRSNASAAARASRRNAGRAPGCRPSARAAAAGGSETRSAGRTDRRGTCRRRPSSERSRLVAAMSRTSTFTDDVDPSRSISFS